MGILGAFASVTSVSPHGPCWANIGVLSEMMCSQSNPIEGADGIAILQRQQTEIRWTDSLKVPNNDGTWEQIFFGSLSPKTVVWDEAASSTCDRVKRVVFTSDHIVTCGQR